MEASDNDRPRGRTPGGGPPDGPDTGATEAQPERPGLLRRRRSARRQAKDESGPIPSLRSGGSSGMPRWLPRAMVLALALLGCYRLADWAFQQLIGLLLDLLIAFFLALAMEPAVDWLAARGMRRGYATAVGFLTLTLAVAGFLAALGSVFADQVAQIGRGLPAYVSDAVDWINNAFGTRLDARHLRENVLHSDWLRGYLRRSAGDVWGISATVLGTVFQFLTVALFTFYFTAEGPRLRRALCSVLPPHRQAEVLRAWEIAVAKTGGYIYSRALMALISGVAHYLFLELAGVPYAPALAIWVGVVSQFLPTVGTYLAGAPVLLIAFTAGAWKALWALVFVVLYQQFENYLLQPRISARTVDIHPAVAFGSVIAGTALLGPVGALISIPATATLQGFLGAYVKRYDVTDPRAEDMRRPRKNGT